MIMEDRILAICRELRTFIEHKKDDIVAAGYSVFENFPKGCCENTTHLLSHLLVYKGLCKASDMKMPWNNHDEKGVWCYASHGWIKLANGLNIDISADQFPDILEDVIVAKDHEVHRRFIGGEWVSFEEHHRRVTWHDEGYTFNRVWQFIIKNFEQK